MRLKTLGLYGGCRLTCYNGIFITWWIFLTECWCNGLLKCVLSHINKYFVVTGTLEIPPWLPVFVVSCFVLCSLACQRGQSCTLITIPRVCLLLFFCGRKTCWSRPPPPPPTHTHTLAQRPSSGLARPATNCKTFPLGKNPAYATGYNSDHQNCLNRSYKFHNLYSKDKGNIVLTLWHIYSPALELPRSYISSNKFL